MWKYRKRHSWPSLNLMTNNEAELYIHIPFCERKCAYCDFLSFPAGEDLRSEYVNALKHEIAAASGNFKGKIIRSVFFGGGTPTVLGGERSAEILNMLFRTFMISKNAEITIECNPGTANLEKLQYLRKAGFNRISIGAQSFDDEKLRAIGRIHDSKTIYKCVSDAKEAGFGNINIDLISALPFQTLNDWASDLEKAVGLKPQHISAYSLILEEGTPLYENSTILEFPDEDTEREMYYLTGEMLSKAGYSQYEISNYSLPGFESIHNSGYWTGVPYLGLGLGASSFTGKERYKNTSDMNEYLENAADPEKQRKDIEELSKQDLENEFMITGLRMTKGVSLEEFAGRFGEELKDVFAEPVVKYLKTGHLIEDKGWIRLSKEAVSVSNTILADFV